jgi:hypothetical protein
MNWIQDHITKDKYLPLLAGILSPAEAVKLVPDNYCVVLDEHSEPVALVTADDLKQAANQGISSLLDIKVEFSPTISIIGYQVDMQDLMNLKSLTERYEEIRGVVVIDDNRVVGILPITTVRNHLKNLDYNRDYELRGNGSSTAGDNVLSGAYKSSLKIVYTCLECGFKNKRGYVEPDNPPDCQNSNKPPHKLKLT